MVFLNAFYYSFSTLCFSLNSSSRFLWKRVNDGSRFKMNLQKIARANSIVGKNCTYQRKQKKNASRMATNERETESFSSSIESGIIYETKQIR